MTLPDYLFLMHNDAACPIDQESWAPYLARLRASGKLRGGSEIGSGFYARKAGPQTGCTDHLTGFMRVTAVSRDDAHALAKGNPVYEAGGTVEIRELPLSAAPCDETRAGP